MSLHRITVVTSTPGFLAEIRAGPTAHSFRDVVSRTVTVGTHAQFDLTGGSHRYYLLWIMRLGGNYHSARIIQVSGSS